MGRFVGLETQGNVNQGVKHLLEELLRKEAVTAALVPTRQPSGKMVMQSLISDPHKLQGIDPFAPVVPTNSAKLLSSLTIKPSTQRIAAIVRSCEVRAFVELVKLHQGQMDNLLLIGTDCVGRFENRDYLKLSEARDNLTDEYLKARLDESHSNSEFDALLTTACKCCVHPEASLVDLRLCLFGSPLDKTIWLESTSDKGDKVIEQLDLKEQPPPPPERRQAALRHIKATNQAYRDRHYKELIERTSDMQGLAEVLVSCINCYNCRVACPVCYCRECVFGTDTFRHEGEQYVKWSKKSGQLKMPTDTVFYHLIRMIHMSTMCVGCGQCTSACPNGIPVSELFATVAVNTQKRFSYVPGFSLKEGQPLATFHEDEFHEVTGQVK